ncbi:TolC family protein [Oceanisphaera sp.]|uniref:TolC family protein n=1 Tax=Oceanisphaera sp. TaxID=1929979 RepID=UPI003A91583C
MIAVRTGLFVVCLSASHLAGGVVQAAPNVTQAQVQVQAAPDGLPAALRAVIRHHPAVKGQLAERDARQYAIDSAKAGRLPSLSAQANNLDDQYEQATLRLQQPLWAFGKIDSDIAQAQASFSAEQLAVLQVKRQLIEETAAVYAKVQGIRQRMLVSAENVSENNKLYRRIERRQQGELASEADVRLAYSRLLQAQTLQATVESELAVTLAELQALTQVPVAAKTAVTEEALRVPSLPMAERQALEHSAEVRVKRARLNVAWLDIEKEKVASLPTVYFRVEQDLLDNPSVSDETRAGLVIEGSLEGLGLVARGRVRGAQAHQEAAQQDLEVAMNEVRRRIQVLMLDRQVKQSLMSSQQLAVAAAEATMNSFMRQYETGRKSWVELLNTQRELTEQRLQLAQLRSEWQILSLRVAALTGGLDQLAEVDA